VIGQIISHYKVLDKFREGGMGVAHVLVATFKNSHRSGGKAEEA